MPKAIVHQPVAQFYDRFVEAIKEPIRNAQIKAALAANAELVLHYWDVGKEILASQKREGWGAKVIDRLGADLQREFPKLAGYSARNLKYMRAFLPRPGPIEKLCTCLVHKFHGNITASSSIA